MELTWLCVSLCMTRFQLFPLLLTVPQRALGLPQGLQAVMGPVLMAGAGADLPALCSNPVQCVLQSFKVPLNGTFIFLPAEGKVLLNSQAGKPEFTQMEQLVQTTEQIPATNQFHTSKERKKGMAEAGQSKQALENSSLLVGIFSCYFSFHIQALLEISRFSKAANAFAFI